MLAEKKFEDYFFLSISEKRKFYENLDTNRKDLSNVRFLYVSAKIVWLHSGFGSEL